MEETKNNPLKTVNNGRDEKGRFAPGNSCGHGRPRNEMSITAKQREMLPLLCPYSKKDETWLEWLADRGLALAGENPAYYRELMDRLEGKVTQPVEGQIKEDISFTIGKGYDQPEVPGDKQDTG